VPGPTGWGTVSGRQFLWGVGLPKGNGGVQRYLNPNYFVHYITGNTEVAKVVVI